MSKFFYFNYGVIFSENHFPVQNDSADIFRDTEMLKGVNWNTVPNTKKCEEHHLYAALVPVRVKTRYGSQGLKEQI
jgi:hypothetical protein